MAYNSLLFLNNYNKSYFNTILSYLASPNSPTNPFLVLNSFEANESESKNLYYKAYNGFEGGIFMRLSYVKLGTT